MTTACRMMLRNGAWTWGLLLVVTLCGCGGPSAAKMRILGDEAVAKRDFVAATEHYRRAVEIKPTDYRAQIAYGEMLMRQRQWFDAAIVFERAWALRPNHAETPAILDHLAESLFQQGNRDGLRAMLRKATEGGQRSRDFLRQGGYLAKIGEMDGAELAFRKAAHFAGPTDAEPYLAMVAFYEQIGDQQKAVTALRRGYGVSPSNIEVQHRLRRYGIVPGPTIALAPERWIPTVVVPDEPRRPADAQPVVIPDDAGRPLMPPADVEIPMIFPEDPYPAPVVPPAPRDPGMPPVFELEADEIEAPAS